MIARWHRFAAVVLMVMLTGAAHACLCVGMGEKAAAATTSTDPHACCKPDVTQTPAVPSSSNDDPCKNCNAQHPLTISVPEKASSAPAPDFAAGVLFAIELPLTQAVVGPAALPGTDHVPIPPQLRDLVHTSCQLTV